MKKAISLFLEFSVQETRWVPSNDSWSPYANRHLKNNTHDVLIKMEEKCTSANPSYDIKRLLLGVKKIDLRKNSDEIQSSISRFALFDRCLV